MINDVRRACFYAKIQRGVYIEVPREDPRAGPDVLGKLRRCLYGTRDAATNWQEEVAKAMVANSLKRGKYDPCLYWHPKR